MSSISLLISLSPSLYLSHPHRWGMSNDMQANLKKLLLTKARTMETKYIVMQYKKKLNKYPWVHSVIDKWVNKWMNEWINICGGTTLFYKSNIVNKCRRSKEILKSPLVYHSSNCWRREPLVNINISRWNFKE